jgi:hypothetical protein
MVAPVVWAVLAVPARRGPRVRTAASAQRAAKAVPVAKAERFPVTAGPLGAVVPAAPAVPVGRE